MSCEFWSKQIKCESLSWKSLDRQSAISLWVPGTCSGVVIWEFDWVKCGVVHPPQGATIVCEGQDMWVLGGRGIIV